MASREEKIKEIIQYAVDQIYTEIGSVGNLFDNAEKAQLVENILSILDDLGLSLEEVFPEAVAEQYATGIRLGEEALITAGLTGEALVATAPTKRIHREALDALVSKGMGDLKSAIATAKESVGVEIEEALNAVEKELGRKILTGDNIRVASNLVAQRFAEHGLTAFVTSDDKYLPLDYYSRLVVRTKLRDANVTGSVNRYTENKVDLVYIDEHHPTCSVCAKRQGLVISLSGDTEGYPTADETGLPPFHPHCQHDIRPYIPEFKSKSEIERDKKPFKPGDDKRTETQRKAYEREQAIRRRASREKKAYEQLKATMGDDAPKTLGAYRRMKRKNDKGWKKLQEEYAESVRLLDEEKV